MIGRITKQDLRKKYEKYVEEKRREISRGKGGKVLKPEEWYTKLFGKKETPPVKEKEVEKILSDPDPDTRKKGFTGKLRSAGSWLKKTGKSMAKGFWEKTKYRYKSMKNAPKNIGKLIRGKPLSEEEKKELTTAATTTAYLALSVAGFGLFGMTDIGKKGLFTVAKAALSKLTPGPGMMKLARELGEGGDAGILLSQAVLEALGEYLEGLKEEEIDQIIKQVREKMLSKKPSAQKVAYMWGSEKNLWP